ncbi:MAG: sugar transferase, partial [Verrucomicrobia bacterium]|nr:sugar transferase [Verrucomicrobiota bacterium]
MLRRDRQIRILIQQLTDACLVAASFWIAYVLRASLYVTNWLGLAPPPPHILTDAGTVLLAVVLIPITPLILESQGFYEHPISGSRAAILWPLVKGCMITVIGLALVAYAFHMPVPRAVPTFYGLISLALLYAKVECRRLMAKGRLHITPHKRRLLLAGTKNELARMCRELEGRRDDAVAIIAQFDLAHPLAQFVQAIHDHSVSGVILSARHTYFEQIENIIKACELEGVEVWLMADFFNTQISHTTSDELFGHPLLIFSSTPQLSWQSMFKQALDFFGAVFLLIVSSPVFAVVSIIIKATSPGPIFFRQKRSGLNGTPFHLYKFRTMVTNAEQFKQELEAMNEMNGPVFKLTNDPRVTGVGKW